MCYENLECLVIGTQIPVSVIVKRLKYLLGTFFLNKILQTARVKSQTKIKPNVKWVQCWQDRSGGCDVFLVVHETVCQGERDPSQLLDSFCFSLHHLPASWISSVCWKTQWAPQQGGPASIRRPPPSITRRLLSQGWVAAMAACRTRCTWGPICCTQTAAEDCPTSYWLVSLTGREPLSCLD